jgi:glycerol-3-phosphate acyltransferase PlsY
MLKGLLPVVIFNFVSKSGTSVFPDYFIYLVAFSAIIGHNFSIFLRFRGGKGVNTTLGASVFIAPVEVFIAVAIYFFVKWKFKFVSVGSMALAISLPVAGFFLKAGQLLQFYLLMCCVMILLRHISNFKRLVTGKEML